MSLHPVQVTCRVEMWLQAHLPRLESQGCNSNHSSQIPNPIPTEEDNYHAPISTSDAPMTPLGLLANEPAPTCLASRGQS